MSKPKNTISYKSTRTLIEYIGEIETKLDRIIELLEDIINLPMIRKAKR